MGVRISAKRAKELGIDLEGDNPKISGNRSSAKAKRELSYRSRPTQEALADAYGWFRDAGYLK